MSKKSRLSLITISASSLLIIGVALALTARTKNFRSIGAQSNNYTLSLVSQSFVNTRRITTQKGNTVNFSLNNVMYYNDWKALAIPSTTDPEPTGTFSNTTPIQQIKTISVTWGSGNLYAYANYTIDLKNENKQVIKSYTQGGLLNNKNEGTCNYDGVNAAYMTLTFTYTMAFTNFVITYTCS